MKLKTFKATLSANLEFANLPERTRAEIINAATIPNPAYQKAKGFSPTGYVDAAIPQNLEFAWDYGGLLCTRNALGFLPKDRREFLKLTNWKDLRVKTPADFPALRIRPSYEQTQIMDKVKEARKRNLRPFGTYLLIASTSVGKTICQAMAAAEFGRKTLVIVDTDLIMRTWYEDLEKAYGLKRKNIGTIKQAKFEIGDQFTIASLQTLGRRREYWSRINKEFGTLIIDEVQGIVAPTLWAFVNQSPAENLIGATATTAMRDGGKNYHLQAVFGEPVMEVHTYHRATITSMPIKEARIVRTPFRYIGQTDSIDWHDLLQEMTGSEERNRLIVENVKRDWMEGRIALVGTRSREHATVLTEMLLEAGVDNVNQINGSTNVNRAYTAQLLKWVKERKVTCIVATAPAIKKGANIPALDSLHIAMPIANKRDVEQFIGRIRRKAPGKTDAIVTYYLDENVPYLNKIYNRIVIPVMRLMKIPGFNIYTT